MNNLITIIGYVPYIVDHEPYNLNVKYQSCVGIWFACLKAMYAASDHFFHTVGTDSQTFNVLQSQYCVGHVTSLIEDSLHGDRYW